MHLPAVNIEKRPAVLHSFIYANPLGILTTSLRLAGYPLLQSSHIPWVIDSDLKGGTETLGRLRGHIARQNPQAKAIIETLTSDPSNSPAQYLTDDVLILFNGPVHHYVTPHFYKDTKPNTGKTVPTWDYEAVEVYGRAKIYFDTKSTEFESFLATQLQDLSQHAETSIMGYGNQNGTRPWKIADAPEKYIELLTKNIIGIEVEITSMSGRFKWSQEKPKGDRQGVIDGFREMGGILGPQVAEKIFQKAVEYDAQKEQK